jgi:hypothetical protein
MENKKQTFKEVFSDMKELFKDIFPFWSSLKNSL